MKQLQVLTFQRQSVQAMRRYFIRTFSRYYADFALLLLCFLYINGSIAQTSGKDKAWFGINNEDWKNGDMLAEADQFIVWDKELGVGSIRFGLDAGSRGMGLRTPAETPNWTLVDAIVAKYQAAGIEIHANLSPGTVSCDGGYNTMVSNYRNYVRQVAIYFKGKIKWYLTGNEPDIEPNRICGALPTAQQAVDLVRVAYEEIKAVNNTAIVESNPPSGPSKDYLREMIRLGVTNYCDVLGTHSYNDQIMPHKLEIDAPWRYINELGAKRVPIISSESSCASSWDGVQYPQEHINWYTSLSYVQYKRYGYSHIMLFDLNGHNEWGIYPGTEAYNKLKNSGYIRKSFHNGGFESSNNVLHDWSKAPANDTEKRDWHTINPVVNGASNGARTGTGYLRINGQAQRVVEYLTPGTPYTIEVYAFVEAGTARLKAMGYNHLNGVEEKTASSSTGGSWQRLSVSFTPTKSWVVIGLQGDGDNVRFDDLSLTSGTTCSNPAAPTSLSASTVSSSQINLRWTDNSSTENGYKVERKTGAAGTYAEIATLGANATSYSSTGLSSSTQYYYRVRAYVSSCNSSYSNEANTTTSGSSQILANGVYKIVSRVSVGGSPVKVLDVAYGTDVNGTNVQIWSDVTPANQRWYVEHLGNNVYKITSQVGSKTRVLDVNGGPGAKANGSNVHLWEYRGNANQQWKIEAASVSGFYKLVANHTAGDTPRKVLDVSGGSNTDGANVQIWEDLNNTAQQWRIEAASAARMGAELAQEAATMQLYPNPASGQVRVHVSVQKAQTAQVQLFNLQGQRLITQTHALQRGDNQFQLSLQSLSKGLYVFKTQLDGQLITQRLVIE